MQHGMVLGVPTPYAVDELAIAKATSVRLAARHSFQRTMPMPSFLPRWPWKKRRPRACWAHWSRHTCSKCARCAAGVSRHAVHLIHTLRVCTCCAQRVNELTRGESLAANIALVKHNAHVGADMAVQLARLRERRSGQIGGRLGGGARGFSTLARNLHTRVRADSGVRRSSGAAASDGQGQPDVVVIGAAVVDLIAHHMRGVSVQLGTSYPGKLVQRFGGMCSRTRAGRVTCDA